MKIALVTDSFTTGGGLEHIYQICSGMPDVEFGVFAKDGDAKEKFKQLSNVKIFSSGYYEKYIKAFNPNIVHIHHLKPLIQLYNIDIKTVFTVHGVHLHKYEFINGIKSKILRFLRLSLEKYLYKRVDEIITVSDDDKTYLKKYYDIDAEVIYNGIDYAPIEQISQSKEQLKNMLNIPQEKQIYLTVARFDFAKAYDVLIIAIKNLRDNGQLDKQLFMFVGDGDLLEEMKSLVNRLKLNDNIIFMGRRNDIYELMKAADCFILPSRWEGLPITLIEAIACKLPIIASDTYGNRTVYNVANQVRLFKNLDAKDLSQKIISTGTAQVTYNSSFTINNMITNIKRIYDNI